MTEINQNLSEEMELAPQEETTFFKEAEELVEEAPVVEEETAATEAPTVVVEEIILPKRPGSPAGARFFTIILALVVLLAGVYFDKAVFVEAFPFLGFLNALPTVELPEVSFDIWAYIQNILPF